jgi:hypothetical protein
MREERDRHQRRARVSPTPQRLPDNPWTPSMGCCFMHDHVAWLHMHGWGTSVLLITEWESA